MPSLKNSPNKSCFYYMNPFSPIRYIRSEISKESS
uniref:Uncharacterized protein n=1 Tax=Rhizophora mucronata TaxID=61149 RepID=A0A2P2Q7X9_RHIMU